MKNNSKYTKIKRKWLDNYKICKLKFNSKISLIKSFTKKTQYFKFSSGPKSLNFSKFKKLTIIDKYILKGFIFSFISVISVLILVIFGRLFVRLLEYVVDGRFGIEMIFSMLFLSTSKSVILLLPFALMISIVISLSRFYRDSEIFALKASGNYKVIFTKIFYLLAVPSFFIIFILNIFISPHLITEIQKKKIEAATTSEIGLKSPGKFIQMKNKNWIIFVENIENDVSKRIFIKSSENNKISIETAEEGDEYIKDGSRSLILKNGQRYTGTPGTGNFQVMKYDTHEIKLLSAEPNFNENYRMKSIFDLISDKNKALSSAEIQWRLFAPISVVILILFAFIFGDVAPRQNKYSNLLSSIIIYFLYSNLVIISVNQIQKESYIFSFIGSWWVHIIAAILCYTLYIMKKRQIKMHSNLVKIFKKYTKK